jgi:hypothetical protein
MSDLTELVVVVGRLNRLRQALEAIQDSKDHESAMAIADDALLELSDDEIKNKVVGNE